MESAGRAAASIAGHTRTDVTRAVFGAAAQSGFDTNSAGGFTMASITANKAQNSGGSGGRSKPVLIDLSGKGISIDTLPVSQNFFDFDGDGYQRRSAWAGKDTGVLVFDADGDGKISRSSEFAFTEWAEGADSDLEALRRVFDTNNNNKLDAGDSRWADFKVWLNGKLVSLASQNIASIDLTATGSGQNFEDGSAITGASTFTRTDGTTGTVGDAVRRSARRPKRPS